jgi:hypothetical protein
MMVKRFSLDRGNRADHYQQYRRDEIGTMKMSRDLISGNAECSIEKI